MVSVEEWQILSFFNTMPIPRDPDVPWPYNDFLFQVERAEMALSCSIDPAHKDVRLILTVSGSTVFELNAMGVVDIRYHNENGRENLEISLSPQVVLWLRLKPAIQIHQVVSETA